MFLFVVIAILWPTAMSFGSGYLGTVTDWLNSVDVQWRQLSSPLLKKTSSISVSPKVKTHLLELETQPGYPNLLLHLLPSPKSIDDCVSPTLAKDMTDTFDDSQYSLLHLHEDIWRSKGDIVRDRLLLRLGKVPQSRIFARKTFSRRITAKLAIPFLEKHHLWSATRAKYYYGLFQKSENDRLVAVATFSSRRKISRDGIPHRSHELIRFCAERNKRVVGGLSKLLRAFIADQQPDDIMTVVDRDWGPGSGWHALGFKTVHIMPPLVMVVGRGDGKRRHLVGAGIKNPTSLTDNEDHTRLGLPCSVLGDLDTIEEGLSATVLSCLAKHDFLPVYDAGVERLMMVVPESQASKKRGAVCEEYLWRRSVPSYAASYYSDVAGINALLRDVEQGIKSHGEQSLLHV